MIGSCPPAPVPTISRGADHGIASSVESGVWQRRRADGAVVRWRVATPYPLAPSVPPFLIEHDSAAAEWTPAVRAARLALAHPLGGSVRLEVLELAVNDVNRTIQRFGRTTELRLPKK